MRFLADENCDFTLICALRDAGHDVVSVSESCQGCERDLLPVRHVGLRRFSGTHPNIMLDRIRSDDITFDPKRCRRKWDKNEIKNLLTLLWESIFRFRLAEFRNYEPR